VPDPAHPLGLRPYGRPTTLADGHAIRVQLRHQSLHGDSATGRLL